MNAIHPKTIFDLYPQSFAATTTLYQSEELRAVAELVSGDVVDLGCGSAKLAPYLQGNPSLKSYMGVDPSAAMLVEARHLLLNLDDPRFSLIHRRMEDCDLTGYDWAVCLNALYAVENPEIALHKIRRMLKPGGHAIITTPNEKLDMEKLLDECRKDLILHPLYHTFRDINRVLAQQYHANFVAMDKLVRTVESAGFEIRQQHSHFFDGGLNFLVVRKTLNPRE